MTLRKLRAPEQGADSLVRRAGVVEEVIPGQALHRSTELAAVRAVARSSGGGMRPSRVTFVIALDFTGDQQRALEEPVLEEVL